MKPGNQVAYPTALETKGARGHHRNVVVPFEMLKFISNSWALRLTHLVHRREFVTQDPGCIRHERPQCLETYMRPSRVRLTSLRAIISVFGRRLRVCEVRARSPDRRFWFNIPGILLSKICT